MLRVRVLFLSHRCTLFRSLSSTPAGRASSACPAEKQQSLGNATRPFSEIPTPGGAIPFIGHMSLLRKFGNGDDRAKVSKELFKEFGPIVRLKTPFGSNIVLIFNPSENETMHRNEGRYPARSKLMSDRMQYLFKDLGLPCPFTFLDGKEWKDMRGLHHKQTQPANVYGYSSGINRATDRLLKALETSSRDEKGHIDVYPLVINWIMEAAAWFSIGADLDLTKGDTEEAVKFQKAVQTFLGSIVYLISPLALYKIYPTQQYIKAKEGFLTLRSIGKKYFDQSRTDVKRKAREGESLCLLDQWIMDGKMSEEQCIISAIDMLAAGIDTTANYSTFLLYELAKHPEVQEKMRQQVVSVLGEEGEADAESLQKMPYLKDVIKETARLNDIFGTSTRDVPQDIEMMGYHIPAKTTIFYPYTARKDLCKEPERFYPDRWNRDDEYKPHPFSVLPFGFGPRGCFGRRFAELEMKLLLIKICRHFDLAADGPPNTRLPISYDIIGRPAVPALMKLSRRL